MFASLAAARKVPTQYTAGLAPLAEPALLTFVLVNPLVALKTLRRRMETKEKHNDC
jgi:hypothetical protein